MLGTSEGLVRLSKSWSSGDWGWLGVIVSHRCPCRRFCTQMMYQCRRLIYSCHSWNGHWTACYSFSGWRPDCSIDITNRCVGTFMCWHQLAVVIHRGGVMGKDIGSFKSAFNHFWGSTCVPRDIKHLCKTALINHHRHNVAKGCTCFLPGPFL